MRGSTQLLEPIREQKMGELSATEPSRMV